MTEKTYPPTLVGGYKLFLFKGQAIVNRNGEVLYVMTTWGTESPAHGWKHYAWFKVGDEWDAYLKAERTSEWKNGDQMFLPTKGG